MISASITRLAAVARRGTAPAILLAALSSAAPAMAQTAEVYVSDGEAFVLEELVVTASSVATDTQNAPASISVIGAEDIQRRGGTDISEALRTAPGVNIGFGSDGGRGISIRGLGSSYTLILVDGKRISTGATTFRHYEGDLDWVPVDAIERIEIVRGPMSTLYGSDAIGGVINIITKRDANVWSGSATAEIVMPMEESTGASRRLSGHISGPLINDVLSFSAYGNISTREADDEALLDSVSGARGTDDFDISGTLSWTPNIDHRVDLQISHGQEHYNDYVAPDAEPPASVTEIHRSAASLSHEGNWGFGTSTTTGFIERSSNVGAEDTIDFTAYQADGRLTVPFDAIWPQSLTIGAELRHETLSDPINLGQTNPLYGDQSPIADLTTAAAFVESQIDLTDSLTLTTGARLDHHEKFGAHLTPRAYLTYALTEDFTVKGGWGQSFKAPDLRQLDPGWVSGSRGRGCATLRGPNGCWMIGNPDLQPETGNSYEIGGYFARDGFEANLTYFYNLIDDKITVSDVAVGEIDGRVVVERVNVDQARTQGLEGGLTVPIGDTLTWSNSFTYLFEALNVSTGQPLAAQPSLAWHSELSWDATEALTLVGSVDIYGEQVSYVEEADTVLTAQVVDPYALVNASASYDLNDNFTVRGGVNNIFDTQPSADSLFKENGRSVFASVTGKF